MLARLCRPRIAPVEGDKLGSKPESSITILCFEKRYLIGKRRFRENE
jgi:hypothetical protein